MREIKFRAWDRKAEQMNCFDSGIFEAKNGWLVFRAMKPFELGGMMELMQSTGLKDKNGTEIYEGDIVKYISIHNPEQLHYNRVVEWEPKRARFIVRKLSGEPRSGGISKINKDAIRKKFEIIGNIYENKELLEQQC